MDLLVLTNVEWGWDCVAGVFTSIEDIIEFLELDSIDELEDTYIIHEVALDRKYED